MWGGIDVDGLFFLGGDFFEREVKFLLYFIDWFDEVGEVCRNYGCSWSEGFNRRGIFYVEFFYEYSCLGCI